MWSARVVSLLKDELGGIRSVQTSSIMYVSKQLCGLCMGYLARERERESTVFFMQHLQFA